jgi:hypothetical protein
MLKQEYTKKQMQELLNNPNIKSCTSKYIIFTEEFKFRAINLSEMWFNHREIFKDFWFPAHIIDSKTPKQSLTNWRAKVRKDGLVWLLDIKRWRKKKEVDPSKMTKDEYIEHLEAQVAYQKEVYKRIRSHYP